MKRKIRLRIAERRKDLGLTQLDLAEAVGVREGTIANWENGRSGQEWFERLSKMCTALDCRIQDLIETQEPQRKSVSLADAVKALEDSMDPSDTDKKKTLAEALNGLSSLSSSDRVTLSEALSTLMATTDEESDQSTLKETEIDSSAKRK